MNLDKKMITVIIVCIIIGGIVGVAVGSFASRGGRGFANYGNGRNMMQRGGGYERGNQYGNWNEVKGAQTAPVSASTTTN